VQEWWILSNDYNPFQENTDGDDIGDICDNCPNDHNTIRGLTDGDSVEMHVTPAQEPTRRDGDSQGCPCCLVAPTNPLG